MGQATSCFLPVDGELPVSLLGDRRVGDGRGIAVLSVDCAVGVQATRNVVHCTAAEILRLSTMR